MELILAIAVAAVVWWSGTGLVLFAASVGERSTGWSMATASGILPMAFCGLVFSSELDSFAAAIAAFCSAVLIWGWHELSFLLGYVTGPNKESCPDDARGFERFVLATKTILHHELAILATAIGIAAMTWGDVNQTGLLTFMVLWIMRISAKLNVFFGVPNLVDEWLPKHLEHLKSFFRKGPVGPWFPLSITLGTGIVIVLGALALHATAGSGVAFGYGLAAALAAIAVVEHWFLVLPIQDTALWRWVPRAKQPDGIDQRPSETPAKKQPLRSSASSTQRAPETTYSPSTLSLASRGIAAPLD